MNKRLTAILDTGTYVLITLVEIKKHSIYRIECLLNFGSQQ